VKHYKKYPNNWKIISLRIRRQRGHKCERCGAPSSRVLGLVVHHKDGNKMNCHPDNLEVLCTRCHFKAGVDNGEITRGVVVHLFKNKFFRLKK